MIDSGRVLIAQARFGDAGLPADWVELAGKDLRLPKGFETVFGYNAIRVPLYAVWGGLEDAESLNGPVKAWWGAMTALRSSRRRSISPPASRHLTGCRAADARSPS